MTGTSGRYRPVGREMVGRAGIEPHTRSSGPCANAGCCRRSPDTIAASPSS